MFGTLKGRIIIILGATALAVYTLLANPINLGLDLQGGMYLALEVEDPNRTMTDDAIRDATDRAIYVIRNRIDQFGVREPLVQKAGDRRIIVELAGIRDEERAKSIIDRQAFLEWKLVLPTAEFTEELLRMDRTVAAQLGPTERRVTRAPTVTDSPSTGQRSIEEMLFGTRADSVRRDTTAADSAAAGRPQADTAAFAPGERPLSSLLSSSGYQGQFLVRAQDEEQVKRYLALPGVIDLLPRVDGEPTELRWDADTISQGAEFYRTLYFLQRRAFITGERLEQATASRDPQFNQTVVTFQLDRRGGRVFEDVTSEHIGDHIAIVLDGEVHSAPVIRGRIGASGQIEMGNASMEEASDLALVLRAGALPAPLGIVEQRSVGASLGEEAVRKGKVAGVVGLFLVVAFMVYIYRLAGAMAVTALGFYVLFVLAMLAGLGANLTAPGIAGFILSIGMAVDANVLIFERIREELEAGRSQRAAVDEGFKNAMSAIIDTHITTIITSLILYQVGTGPVQGFAVTLSIGILASFFTAVYITRTLFLIYLDRKQPAKPISI